MSKFLFRKPIDQSLLKSGLTIQTEYHKTFLEELGVVLQRGEKTSIQVIIRDNVYNVTLTSVAHGEKYPKKETLQIRYAEGDQICKALKSIFEYSDRLISKKKELTTGKTRIIVDEEYMDVYAVDTGKIEMKCHPMIVDQKISIENREGLYYVLDKFLTEYIDAKSEPFAGNAFGIFIRNTIPDTIYKTDLVDSERYLVTGSVGQGNWAMIPWICIFDRSVTTTATKGVYIVYLLSKDGKALYLTLNQGCTDIRSNNSKKETIRIMREKAKSVISKIDSRGFASDQNIYLGDKLTELGELYQKGTIFYKKYTQGSVPSELELRRDLSNILDIYRDYVCIELGQHFEQEEEKTVPISTKEAILQIESYIAAKGFHYNKGLIENFFLCLKSKPFVILAGISGTGKTRLVELFAEAIGAEYKLVPVRPDWSDSSDLFGHLDLNGRFFPGVILKFLKMAIDHPNKPYFLCLDEMNLARVEYYLSDLLSVIETRKIEKDNISSYPLITIDKYGADESAFNEYGEICFPQNLYLVGTVNMDETTFPFSKKVLDRANTIEFNYVNLIPDLDSMGEIPDRLQLPNSFLKSEYLFLSQCAEDMEYVNEICAELQRINKILEKGNAHVGYRVRDEIVFYMLNNKNEGSLIKNEEAFDNEIMQKVLPRIQGSSTSVLEVLCELFKVCAVDHNQSNGDSDADRMKKVLRDPSISCKYPKSAEKLELMVRRFEEEGFTSYWL